MLDMLWNCDRALRFKLDCLAKMQSRRRAAVRKHMEKSFDKCTSEYYSCSRKGVHGRKVVREFAPQFLSNSMHIADAGELHGHSSTLLDTAGSDVSSVDADTTTQPVSPCALSYRSQDECLLDKSIELGKIKGVSIQHPTEDKRNDFDACYSVTESLPLFGSSFDESDSMTRGVNNMGANFSASRNNVDCVHDFVSGFRSQRGLNEKENKCGVTIPTLSLSPARGGHRRTFPPPLSSVAMQSYCDKQGQSPSACNAGACLRSFRSNGRFVLQEVKAPTHRFFRVLRGDGRLKMELVNAENDSSAEEDEVCASGVCGRVKNSDSVVEMIPQTSKISSMDACVGSTCSSTPYGEGTCIASSQIKKPMSLDCRAGISTEGCENATKVMDTPAIYAEKGKPLICVVPEALSTPETIPSDSPSSPGCLKIRPLYSGPSPRMKSSWVRPISAF